MKFLEKRCVMLTEATMPTLLLNEPDHKNFRIDPLEKNSLDAVAPIEPTSCDHSETAAK